MGDAVYLRGYIGATGLRMDGFSDLRERGVRLIVISLVAVISACSHVQAFWKNHTETVFIEVTHLPERALWKVEYELADRVKRLEFVRRFDSRRHEDWRVATPEMRLVEERGREYLERNDGTAFTRVTLIVPSDARRLNRDYALTGRFTDGSEWLYTGHFLISPHNEEGQPSEVVTAMTLHPREGETLLIDGESHRGQARWRTPKGSGRGTFAYFGEIAPDRLSGRLIVIDPGLPPALRQSFVDYLPKLDRELTASFRQPLSRLQSMLIAYDPSVTGRSYGGDALPEAMAFLFRGSGWERVDDAARINAIGLLAHELVHNWNGALFTYSDNARAPWVHEGAAEFLSWQAMQTVGLLDRDAFEAKLEAAFNRCFGVNGLRGDDLQTASAAGRVQVVAYSCGAVMNAVAATALGDAADGYALWRTMFERAHLTQNTFSEAQVLALVSELDPPLGNLLSRAARGPTPPPVELVAAMNARGFDVQVQQAPPKILHEYALRALGWLMASDCQGREDIWYDRNGATIGGLPQCRTLNTPEIEVEAVAGVPITKAMEVYRAVAARCRTRRDVQVTVRKGKSLTLSCPSKALPSAPPYWSVHLR